MLRTQELFKVIKDNYSCIPFQKLDHLWNTVRDCPEGDILEVGCWRGGSSLMIADSARTHKPNSHVFVCDTFEGIVLSSEKDNYHKDGDFGDTTSKELVDELLTSYDLKNYSLHKGIFPHDTGEEVTSTKLAFVHVDVDVYEGHMGIFRWLEGKLVPGAIIIFDDYMSPSCLGATKAVHEYFDNNPDFEFHYEAILLWPENYWHKGYVVYKPN